MRIKYRLLERIKNLTPTEMNFLLYIAKKQNLQGRVLGVHNQDVCINTGMCKQSFYTAMRGLESKGIISVKKATDIDYDIVILDNDFNHEEDFKEGYINLQRSVFHRKQFKQLKVREKWMLMYFLHITHEGSGSYCIGSRTFYNKFAKLLGLTERVIRSYLHVLRSFFSVGLVKGKYYITYLHRVFHPKDKKKVEEWEHENFVQAIARRNKIRNITEQELAKTAELVKQYRHIAKEQGYNIYDVLRMAIEIATAEKERPKDRRLKYKYIHKLVRKALALD